MAISLNQPAPTLAPKIETKPANVSKGSGINLFGSPVKTQDVIFFSSQLSLMLEIGTPLKTALETLGKQLENEDFKEIIASMVKDIEAGRQLSDAMQKHPKVFDSIYSSMVRAGETGGFLKDILDRIKGFDAFAGADLNDPGFGKPISVQLTHIPVGDDDQSR